MNRAIYKKSRPFKRPMRTVMYGSFPDGVTGPHFLKSSTVTCNPYVRWHINNFILSR